MTPFTGAALIGLQKLMAVARFGLLDFASLDEELDTPFARRELSRVVSDIFRDAGFDQCVVLLESWENLGVLQSPADELRAHLVRELDSGRA